MKDLIIIGNGIAGITAAIYAKRANLDFEVIGREQYSSGQIENATVIENYPGLAGATGVEFSNRLQEHLDALGVEVIEGNVDYIEAPDASDSNSSWGVYLENGQSFDTKTVIFAGGAKHKTLNIPSSGRVEYHYCATCDGALYKNKDVAVIGGGNVAFTEALYLANICRTVYILMCDDNITADITEVERAKNTPNIILIKDYPVEYIDMGIDFYNLISGQAGCKVQGIFVAIGMEPEKCPYDLETENGYIRAGEDGIPIVQLHSETYKVDNGFYIAGDVRTKQLRQSITAAADGANCVASVINYLKK